MPTDSAVTPMCLSAPLTKRRTAKAPPWGLVTERAARLDRPLGAASVVIEHPEAREPEVERSERCDDHQQEPGHGGRVAHVKVGEPFAVQVEGIEQGRVG